jgi:DNA-binding NarL/FixJ family response regulator
VRRALRWRLGLAIGSTTGRWTGSREELEASGARLRRVELTGPESLTPSERRIAELAATGNTNREIAQRLF